MRVILRRRSKQNIFCLRSLLTGLVNMVKDLSTTLGVESDILLIPSRPSYWLVEKIQIRHYNLQRKNFGKKGK